MGWIRPRAALAQTSGGKGSCPLPPLSGAAESSSHPTRCEFGVWGEVRSPHHRGTCHPQLPCSCQPALTQTQQQSSRPEPCSGAHRPKHVSDSVRGGAGQVRPPLPGHSYLHVSVHNAQVVEITWKRRKEESHQSPTRHGEEDHRPDPVQGKLSDQQLLAGREELTSGPSAPHRASSPGPRDPRVLAASATQHQGNP